MLASKLTPGCYTSSPSWTPRRCQTVAEKGQKNNRCSVVSGAPPQTLQVTLSTIFFLKRFVLHCRRPCRTNQAKKIRGGAHERQNELSICCGWSLLDLIILYSPEVISAPPSATVKGVLRRSSTSVRATPDRMSFTSCNSRAATAVSRGTRRSGRSI